MTAVSADGSSESVASSLQGVRPCRPTPARVRAPTLRKCRRPTGPEHWRSSLKHHGPKAGGILRRAKGETNVKSIGRNRFCQPRRGIIDYV